MHVHITNEITRTAPMIASFVSMSPQHSSMFKKTGNKNDEKRMWKILVTVRKAKLNVMIAIALEIMEEDDINSLLVNKDEEFCSKELICGEIAGEDDEN